MDDIHHRIGLLAAGASAWAGRSPSRRADLAVRTVHSTLAAANAWVEAATDIKRSRAPAVRAEETATGPLVTLRLLLITARALADIERDGVPRLARPVRAVGREPAWIEVEALPASGPRGSLLDGTVFAGQRATIRCVDPGGVEAFERSWRDEVSRRPLTGGVAAVLGAGNVTGLAAGDCVSQIFEYGRAVLLKLHPLHAPLRPVLERALEPLVEAGLLTIVAGGVEVARAALSAPGLDHVHLTGGAAAFDALVWGGRDRRGAPVISQSVSCELGNVTPWFIVPGRYTSAELSSQADIVAASIMNNTSFNCIATKLIVTARSWDQREAFLARVQDRLSRSPTRPAWYPGSVAAWETLAGSRAPADGALPWMLHTGIDPDRDPRFVDREWFVPVAAEIPVAADSVERFCTHAHELARRLPGSLAASVTLPPTLSAQDAARAGRLVEHLPFGVVAVNAWSALAYSLANVPWGGFPGATLAEPASGIGRVHDPYMLPLVHNTILRAPLASRLKPAWFPWHPYGALLARGLVDTYGAIAAGRSGMWRLARLLPAILAG